MNSTLAIATSIGAAALMALPACQGSGSYAKLQDSLTQIGVKQDQLLAHLDRVETKIGNAGAAPARPNAKPQPRPGRPESGVTYKVPVSGRDAVKGAATAKVTIVEWSDFQCPFCSRVAPTIEQIEEQYGDDVRVVFKHNPLPMHDRAMAAALAAEAANRQGKFWEMHDELFANQRALTQENFDTWAEQLGLDVTKFRRDMADPALRNKAEADQRLASTLGARATPAFYINGRFLSGAQPFPAFKALIDEELNRADKLLAAGTPKEKVYDKVIGNGKTKV